ncbi:helix-turn-helix domain-containing protein [Citricoccus sp.]|uniref:helix-turn-helix domain-containing protein n=1 Tax=Citricoccus sp. TaxID=1978372 RepID=UPI0028BF0A51|nr:helix-turn-helix domain-containing protein [Citricoccus sp.]
MPTVLLSVKQAAERLGEHPDTTRARLRAGDLKGTRLTERGPWKITESALEHFIKKNTRI